MRSQSEAAVKQGGGAGLAVHVDAGGECWTEVVLRLTEEVLVRLRLVTVTVLRGTALPHHSSVASTHFTAGTSWGRGAGAGRGVLGGGGGAQHGGGGGGRGAAVKQLTVALEAIEVQTSLVLGTIELPGITGSRVASSRGADTEG